MQISYLNELRITLKCSRSRLAKAYIAITITIKNTTNNSICIRYLLQQLQYFYQKNKLPMFNLHSQDEFFPVPIHNIYFDDESVQNQECYKPTFIDTSGINLQGMNIQDMHKQDFNQLIKKYPLTQVQRKNYEAHFIKTKRILKRQKAKQRFRKITIVNCQLQNQNMMSETNSKQETDIQKDQDQKRKKRISAQISRDRKKIYLEKLEEENKVLLAKCASLNEQNTKLKQQNQLLKMNSKNSVNPINATKPKKSHTPRTLKGIFIMSLILLTSLNKRLDIIGEVKFATETLFAKSNQILKEFTVQNQYVKIFSKDLQHFETDIKQRDEQCISQKEEQLIFQQDTFEFRCNNPQEEIRLRDGNRCIQRSKKSSRKTQKN